MASQSSTLALAASNVHGERWLRSRVREPVARRKAHAIHDSPRMTEPRRRCAAVSFGVSFRAFQNCELLLQERAR